MDILQSFSQWLFEEGRAKKTIDSYVSDIKGYMQYCNEKGDGDQPLLSRFLFVKYKEHLIEHDYAVSTINKKINSLKVFNDFLSSKQLVNQVFIKMKRDRIKVASGSESVVTVLSDAEVDHLLFDLEHNPNISQRNRLLVYFLLYTGVRVSELVSIKITDIDYLTAILTVRGKGGKIREINLRQDLLSHLHQYLRGERQQSKFQDSVYLFVSQRSPYLHRDAVRRWLIGWSKDVGIVNI